jgi:hypothetical protein
MGGMGGIVGMVYVHLVVYLYLSQIGHGDLYSFIWCLYPLAVPSKSLKWIFRAPRGAFTIRVYLYLSQIGGGDLYSFIWCLYPHGGSLQIVPMSLWSAARRLSETSLSLLILAIYVFVLVEYKLAALRYVALRCAALRCWWPECRGTWGRTAATRKIYNLKKYICIKTI